MLLRIVVRYQCPVFHPRKIGVVYVSRIRRGGLRSDPSSERFPCLRICPYKQRINCKNIINKNSRFRLCIMRYVYHNWEFQTR